MAKREVGPRCSLAGCSAPATTLFITIPMKGTTASFRVCDEHQKWKLGRVLNASKIQDSGDMFICDVCEREDQKEAVQHVFVGSDAVDLCAGCFTTITIVDLLKVAKKKFSSIDR